MGALGVRREQDEFLECFLELLLPEEEKVTVGVAEKVLPLLLLLLLSRDLWFLFRLSKLSIFCIIAILEVEHEMFDLLGVEQPIGVPNCPFVSPWVLGLMVK
jgi:hypothetical protein